MHSEYMAFVEHHPEIRNKTRPNVAKDDVYLNSFPDESYSSEVQA